MYEAQSAICILDPSHLVTYFVIVHSCAHFIECCFCLVLLLYLLTDIVYRSVLILLNLLIITSNFSPFILFYNY